MPADNEGFGVRHEICRTFYPDVPNKFGSMATATKNMQSRKKDCLSDLLT